MSAALEHPIGPTTVADWLAQDHPTNGSRLELILGYPHVSPPPSGQHQHATYELAQIVRNALRAGGRSDLHVVPGVGIRISTAWRTALIPDVSVLNIKPIGVSFGPEHLVLAVEVWSPGNTKTERDTKMAAYAGADVPFFWAVNEDRLGAITVSTYRLEDGRYDEELTAGPGQPVTIKAAPVPVTFDPAELNP